MRDVKLSQDRIVRAVIETAWDEIITDMRRKTVPLKVRSFSELHDYVDANLYGGSSLLLSLLGMNRAMDILSKAFNALSDRLARAEHVKTLSDRLARFGPLVEAGETIDEG